MQHAKLGQVIELHLEQRAHLCTHQRVSAIISFNHSISIHRHAIKINQRTVQCAGPSTATTAGSSAGS
jgi:hypothetical protein